MIAPTVFSRVAIMMMFAMVSGCTVFPEQAPHRMFLLPVSEVPESTGERLDLTLRVYTPHAVAPLDSARIVVRPGGNELSVYGGARWNENASVLLRDHLIESFRQDGRFASVVNEDNPSRSDLLLVSDLNGFHAEYRDGKPVAVIRLDVQLIAENNRGTLATRRFEVSEPSASEKLDDVVSAFGRASTRLGQQVADWAVTCPRT